MLTIVVEPVELFDDEKQQFLTTEALTFDLEHSLVSLSKWESIWEKPFLGPDDKTTEETFSYIECMCLTEGIPPETFRMLSAKNVQLVNEYVNKKMTATWFNKKQAGPPSRRETITAEVIYYWMVAQSIPIETEAWHLNRLLTLIQVTSEKNAPKKKMSRREAAQQQRMLNQQRQAKFNTQG